MWALFYKTLPGLAISFALAVVFNLPLSSGTPERSSRPRSSTPYPALYHNLGVSDSTTTHDDTINPILTARTPHPAENRETTPLPIPPPRESAAGTAKPAWSSTALASMALPVTAEACPPPPPTPVGVHPLELPDRGMYLWADGEAAKARLKKSRNGVNAFDVDEKQYTLGLKYDWSIDSVVGLSVSRLDVDVDSRFSGDSRRNTVKGTVFTGRYDGYLFGKYPLALRGSYGRLDTDGGGAVDGYLWREDERTSDYYALSATFGVPLVFRNRFKLLTEIGLDYRKLKTGAYDYTVDGRRFAAPGATSESLLIPFDFTLRCDYPRMWGFLTTYAGCGLAVELKDSATGVRAWNAASASASRFTSGPGPVPMVDSLAFDAWKSVIGTVTLGVEAKTVGGWELRADYRRTMASGFAENRFGLELGRCF